MHKVYLLIKNASTPSWRERESLKQQHMTTQKPPQKISHLFFFSSSWGGGGGLALIYGSELESRKKVKKLEI